MLMLSLQLNEKHDYGSEKKGVWEPHRMMKSKDKGWIMEKQWDLKQCQMLFNIRGWIGTVMHRRG
jgi:hypothetical protein